MDYKEVTDHMLFGDVKEQMDMIAANLTVFCSLRFTIFIPTGVLPLQT